MKRGFLFYGIAVCVVIVFGNCTKPKPQKGNLLSLLAGMTNGSDSKAKEIPFSQNLALSPEYRGLATTATTTYTGAGHCVVENGVSRGYDAAIASAVELVPGMSLGVTGADQVNVCFYKITANPADIMDILVTPTSGVQAAGYVEILNNSDHSFGTIWTDNGVAYTVEEPGSIFHLIDVPFYNDGDFRYVQITYLNPAFPTDPTVCSNGDCGFSVVAISRRNNPPTNCSRDFQWSLQHAMDVTLGTPIVAAGASFGDTCVYRISSTDTREYNISATPAVDTSIDLSIGLQGAIPTSTGDYDMTGTKGKVIESGNFRYVWVHVYGNCGRDNCQFELNVQPDQNPNCVDPANFSTGVLNAVTISRSTPYTVNAASPGEMCLFKFVPDLASYYNFNATPQAGGIAVGSSNTVPSAPLLPAGSGARLIADLIYSSPGYFDYFQVNLPPDYGSTPPPCPYLGCQFSVEVNPSRQTWFVAHDNNTRCAPWGIPVLGVYDETGTVHIKDSAGTSSNSLMLGLEYGKTYKLRVLDRSYYWYGYSSNTLRYSIEWGQFYSVTSTKKRPACPDDYEPFDNTPSGATLLPENVIQDHTIHTGTDEDWFTIVMPPL